MSRHTVCSSSVETVSCKKFCRRFAGHHISLEKQTNPVCILCYKFHIMGDHKDRDAMLLKFLKDFPQFLFILCIQPLGWLVHPSKEAVAAKEVLLPVPDAAVLLRLDHKDDDPAALPVWSGLRSLRWLLPSS